MTEDEVTFLLGRNLSPGESDNFDLCFDIAVQILESLFCMDLDVVPEGEGSSSTQVYLPRVNYRTLYVSPYASLEAITYNDEVLDTSTFTQRQFGTPNTNWYNVIEFEDPMLADDKILITAVWGLSEYPPAMKLLLARAFATVGSQPTNVKSKSNEGFSVEYTNTPMYDQFVLDNAALINMFRVCDTTIVYSNEYL